MPGRKEVNSDLDVKGKIIVDTVPNNTGTVVTYNSTTKEFSTRSNTDIISDLSLMTTNTAQDVTGLKTFRNNSGSNDVFANIPLRVLGSNGTRAGICFYSTPNMISAITLDYSGKYHFTGDANISQGYNIIKVGGVERQNSSDNHVLLGAGGHKLISDFVLTTNTTYVPYTGANQDLNLNTRKITSVGTINHGGTLREVANVGRFRDVISIDNNNIIKQQSQYWNGTAMVNSDSYFYGSGSGNFSLGTKNLGIGEAVLERNSGSYNIGIGIGTLRYSYASSTTNAYNVGIGVWAGQYNDGLSNLMIGQLYTGQYNRGSSSTLISNRAGEFNVGNNIISIGNSSSWMNVGGNNLVIGENSLRYGTGSNHTIIGRNSFITFKHNSAGSKIFDYTAIDVAAKTISIPNHGFGNTNTYVILLFTQGDTPITGIANGNVIQVKIVDENTLLFSELLSSGQYRHSHNITNAGTGTGHIFTPQFVFNHVNILGTNLEPTKSNQTLFSGGEALLPQSTVGTIDADTTNKSLITKEWFTAKSALGFTVGNNYGPSQSLNTVSGNQVFRSQGAIGTAGVFGHATGIQVTQGTTGNSYGWQLISDGNKIGWRYNTTDNYASSIWRTFWDSSNFNPNDYVLQSSLNTQLSDYVKKSDTVKVTITGITQDVTHNFNTYDIVCEAYDTVTLYNLPIKYKRKNLNTVTIEFDNPVPNSVRLMITKK